MLFIVPTLPLLEQQAHAVQTATGLAVAKYQGGKQAPNPDTHDVIIATPAAYHARALECPEKFGYARFCMIIFDEVHHTIKKHPYRSIARSLKGTVPTVRPKILGLTASLTYAVGEGACATGSGRALTLVRHRTISARCTLTEPH